MEMVGGSTLERRAHALQKAREREDKSVPAGGLTRAAVRELEQRVLLPRAAKAKALSRLS